DREEKEICMASSPSSVFLLIIVLIASVANALPYARQTNATSPMNANTVKVKDLTGPGITTRFSMDATDLGIPIRTRDGTLFIFGDTFKEARVGGGDWRSPVGLFSTTTNLNAGVTWVRAAGPNPNYASQLLPYVHNVGFST